MYEISFFWTWHLRQRGSGEDILMQFFAICFIFVFDLCQFFLWFAHFPENIEKLDMK